MAKVPAISTYRPGTGLLLDLVAMRITDVHTKWTAGSAGPLASGAREARRFPAVSLTARVHAPCSSDTPLPFPPLQMK